MLILENICPYKEEGKSFQFDFLEKTTVQVFSIVSVAQGSKIYLRVHNDTWTAEMETQVVFALVSFLLFCIFIMWIIYITNFVVVTILKYII